MSRARIEEVHERDGSWWPAVEVKILASEVHVTQEDKTIVLAPAQLARLLEVTELAHIEQEAMRSREREARRRRDPEGDE